MAGFQEYLRPVLVVMSTLETSMLNVGAILWYQTKVGINGLFWGLQSRATDAYQDVRRRASTVYEDIQVRASDKYQVVQRTSETCQRWLNRVNLVYIECQLRLNLAVHHSQFQLSLLCKDVKSYVGRKFHTCVGVHLKYAQLKAVSMHRWTRIKVTRIKKAAAESAKVTLGRMSLKAREYEDIFDEKLSKLSRCSSTKENRMLQDSWKSKKPVLPPRKRSKTDKETADSDCDSSKSSRNSSKSRSRSVSIVSKSSLEEERKNQ